uniref:Uncharacterized protein n=1 Tax=Mycena chlorophos TaxID=658473 RepID=A0ABQ0LAA5_MYCCL|nr:predicted protein [Mycena chlorophos]
MRLASIRSRGSWHSDSAAPLASASVGRRSCRCRGHHIQLPLRKHTRLKEACCPRLAGGRRRQPRPPDSSPISTASEFAARALNDENKVARLSAWARSLTVADLELQEKGHPQISQASKAQHSFGEDQPSHENHRLSDCRSAATTDKQRMRVAASAHAAAGFVGAAHGTEPST